jgi:hypothetical protein
MPTEGLPPAYQGMPFHSSVMAAGGVGPYTMSLSGDLPPGVIYDPGYNVITLDGVPTATGTFNAQITVTDALRCPGHTVLYARCAPRIEHHAEPG